MRSISLAATAVAFTGTLSNAASLHARQSRGEITFFLRVTGVGMVDVELVRRIGVWCYGGGVGGWC